MQRLLACLLTLSLLVTAVTFPLPAQDSPEDAVRQFLLRTQTGDWRGAAGLVRGRAQESFRTMVLSQLVSEVETRVRQRGGRVAAPQPYGRTAPMAERLAFLDTVPVAGLRRPLTVGEIARLPAAELLEEALVLQYTAGGPEMRVLGGVVESDSTGWAVIRRVIPHAPPQFAMAPTMVFAAPLHRESDGWQLGYAPGLIGPDHIVVAFLRDARGTSSNAAIYAGPLLGPGYWPLSDPATVAECDARRVYFRIGSSLPETVAHRYTQVAEVSLMTELGRSGRIVAPSPVDPADSVSVLVVTLNPVSDGTGVRIELGFRRGTTSVAGGMRSLVPLSADQVNEGAAALRARLSEMLEGFSAGGLPGPCR